MRRVAPRTCVLALLLGGAALAVLAAEHAPLPEMWTLLAARLDSGTLKAGDAVQVQVAQS